MKLILLTLAVLVSTAYGSVEKVSMVLDNLHKYASLADGDHYFSLFSEKAHFIGTDIEETWTIAQFKEYAMPHFKKGNGWTYNLVSRDVSFSSAKDVAWFIEILDSKSYGKTRGTGVLVKEKGEWKIAQYHLTIPVPNSLAKQFTDSIKAMSNDGKK